MRVLVLGSTGFIGKSLTSRLRLENHEVFTCSRSEGIDILNYNLIAEKIKLVQPEIIFNVATHGGSIHYVSEKAGDVFNDNVQMVLNIYNAVKEHCPTAKIINPFSNCSYPGDSLIQNEESWLSGEVHPSIFSFGNSKRTTFYLSWCFNKQHGIKTVNLLFPNTYGPGDSCDPNKTHALNGIIIRMLKAKRSGDDKFIIWGTGKPIREWAYVDDFTEALIRAINIEHLEYPINVGQQRGYSILESTMMVQKACGYEGNIICDLQYPDGDAVKVLGNSKFHVHFPEFEFYDHEKGIENTVSYYKENL